MTKEQVAELIGQIPQGLAADEFLVALANKAADFQKAECVKKIETETEDYDRHYREYALEIAEMIK